MSEVTVRKTVPVDAVRIDGGTQSRLKINLDTVASYAEKMEHGEEFPPVVVFFDGKDMWMGDGFHRYHAVKKNGKASIRVDVINGTVRDAILHSYGANGQHGLPMSNEDKWSVVLEMVRDFEWGEWSNREIARQCNVSHVFVAKVRASLTVIEKVEPVIEKGGNVIETSGNVTIDDTKVLQPKIALPVAEYEKLQETIDFLIKENESLTDKLAVGSSDDPEFASKTIDELRDENKQLKIEVRSLTISRDQFQTENAQLIKQVNYLTKKLKK
jgi:cell division protein FtsB